MIKDLIEFIDIGIEEIILVFLIILNILDFFGFLPTFLDYVKKIISWTILGYLIYRSSLSSIMFGKKNKKIDGILVTLYFFLVIKDLTSFISGVYEVMVVNDPYSILMPIYSFIAKNVFAIDHIFFLAGMFGLLAMSLYLGLRHTIVAPSFLEAIHEQGPPPVTFGKKIIRIIVIYLSLVSFFVIFFNLFMEWMAFAVDSLIVLIGIFFYIFIFGKHAKKFSAETLIYKIADFGEEFYKNMVMMFKDRTKIMLGISGMLVLHLLTDIGNFIIPYVVGLKKTFYFETLGIENHRSLFYHMFTDLSLSLPIYEKFGILLIYALNLFAILFLLILPGFIWYLMYSGKHIKIHNYYLALFFSCFSAFILMPVFVIDKIKVQGVIGTDIITQSLMQMQGSFMIQSFLVVALISVLIGIIALFASIKHSTKMFLEFLILIITMLWFAYYLFFFFITSSQYYLNSTIYLAKNLELSSAIFMLIIYTINLVFYIGGFFTFGYLIVKRKYLERIQTLDEL